MQNMINVPYIVKLLQSIEIVQMKLTLKTGGGLMGLCPADRICARVTLPEPEAGNRNPMRMYILSIHSTRPVNFRLRNFVSSCWSPEITRSYSNGLLISFKPWEGAEGEGVTSPKGPMVL